MKDLFDIVRAYDSLSQKNLFPETTFSDERLWQIGQEIETLNHTFFRLVEKLVQSYNFGYNSLEMVINKLRVIYDDLYFELSAHVIEQVENRPLFRYKIQFDPKPLTLAFSKVEIIAGIVDIYYYLEDHFSRELELGERMVQFRFDPPYVDEEGYILHVYRKLLSNGFVQRELYGYKERWLGKIDEFFKIVPGWIIFALPTDGFKKEPNENDKEFDQKELFQRQINLIGLIDNGEDSLDQILFELSGGYKTAGRTAASNDSFKIGLVFPINNLVKVEESLRKLSLYLINSGEISKSHDLNVLKRVLLDHDDTPVKWEGRLNVLYYIFNFASINKIDNYSGQKYECLSKIFVDSEGNRLPPKRIKGATSFKGYKELDDLLLGLLESCQKS